MTRRATLLALMVWGVSVGAAHAQGPIVVRLADAGPGTGPAILAHALEGRHHAIPPGTTAVTLRRDTTYNETVIVLGRDAIVESEVRGDVIVVGADLYMHPGGRIAGRAIAIGGGVYESALARIGGAALAFRDFTYDITGTDGAYELRYREMVERDSSVIAFRGIYGLAIPTYDRSNGLSLSFGPRLSVPNTRFSIEPRLTYRSQLGAWDMAVLGTDSINRRTALSIDARQGTFTNDAWIWSDLLNSTEFLFFGHDSRNYFRGQRADISLGRRVEGVAQTLTASLTGRVERTHSVRPDSIPVIGPGFFKMTAPTGGPFTFLGRHDADDRLRPNPRMQQSGAIASGIATVQTDWDADNVIARVRADVEIGRFWPSDFFVFPDALGVSPSAQPDFHALDENRNFGQLTVDGSISFPTFGTQSLSVSAHSVLTTRGLTPRQRFAYLGGSGTIPTLEMLELGGDQLLYLDSRYSIPIKGVMLPVVGSPTIVLRHALGSAGVGGLPKLEQATGFRLVVSFLYGEFLIDPVTRHTHRTVGLTLAR